MRKTTTVKYGVLMCVVAFIAVLLLIDVNYAWGGIVSKSEGIMVHDVAEAEARTQISAENTLEQWQNQCALGSNYTFEDFKKNCEPKCENMGGDCNRKNFCICHRENKLSNHGELQIMFVLKCNRNPSSLYNGDRYIVLSQGNAVEMNRVRTIKCDNINSEAFGNRACDNSGSCCETPFLQFAPSDEQCTGNILDKCEFYGDCAGTGNRYAVCACGTCVQQPGCDSCPSEVPTD